MSGRLVEAITIMPSLVLKPSISTKSWFKVCSLSSWPPPKPAPRWRPTASISSINTIQGAFFLACSNKSRTRAAPTPTNISTKSEPLMEKKGTAASPATALAISVFPVPGAPYSNTPFGILAPICMNFPGFLRNSTTSCISSLASSAPATSAKVILTSSPLIRRALLLPNCITLFPPPWVWFIMNIRKAISKMIGNKVLNRVVQIEGGGTG